MDAVGEEMSLNKQEWMQVANAVTNAARQGYDGKVCVSLETVLRTLHLHAEPGAYFKVNGAEISFGFEYPGGRP